MSVGGLESNKLYAVIWCEDENREIFRNRSVARKTLSSPYKSINQYINESIKQIR